QLAAFLAVLKEHPEIEIKDKEPLLLEPDAKHRLAPGHGLSARRFVRIVEKNLKADAIVSFVGVPDPDDSEMKTLTVKVPRFLAVAPGEQLVRNCLWLSRR